MMKNLSTPGIIINPNIRSGRPCIAGTGLRVTDIVMAAHYEQRNRSEIAADFQIALAEVDAALNYYQKNKAAIDADIHRQIETFETLAKQGYGKPRDSLLSR